MRPLQRHYTELGLKDKHTGNLHARICQGSPTKVPAPHSIQTTEPPNQWKPPNYGSTAPQMVNQAPGSPNPPLPWIQNSETIVGDFTSLCARGRPHHASGIEQHIRKTGQHHTHHGQISGLATKLWRQKLRGHQNITRKWNGTSHQQWFLLLVRYWRKQKRDRI